MTSTVHILHVDDEPGFADMTARFLEREDNRFSVETATTVTEGLDYLAETAVDCVISDYEMPGQSGIEFLRAVREEYSDLPFILFTGKGSEDVASEAISVGVTDYLQKSRGNEQYTILANRILNAVERRHAERKQQRQLDAIETAQEGISILDADGKYIYVNQAYADFYQYAPAELIGEHWETLYPDDDIPAIEEEVMATVDEYGYWHGTTTGLRADGTTFTEDHILSTTKSGELVCTVRDIDEQKERERAIHELHNGSQKILQADTAEDVADITTEALRDILDMPLSGVWFADEEGEILRPVTWTEQATELIGDHSSISLGDGLAWEAFESGEARHYNDVSTVAGRLNQDTAIRSEIILPLGDHGVLTIGSTTVNAFDDGDLSLAQTLAAHTQIALDRLERGNALRNERVFIEQAINTLDDLFYVIDTDGKFIQWNNRLTEVTGYADEEVATMTAEQFFPEDERDRIVDAIEATFSEGEQIVEGTIRTADGEEIPHEFTGARLTDREGELVGLVGVGRNIAERKQREQQLQQQNERLNEFASVVSHDLRNPLNVAHGNLALVRDEYESGALDEIAAALDRMQLLIDDLLTLAQEGQTLEEMWSVNLAEIARTSWKNVETRDAALSIDTDRTIYADASRVQQLLENLIRNAVEHGGEDVTLTIGELTHEDGFYVEDDGSGIPPDKRDTVFQSGYSTSTDGTGFGLSIVKNIVDAHDWTIQVTEGRTGRTRFEITGVEDYS
ncbi:hybrid sensor histidine kinase/response regulator [Haloterrigena alkaliphila]|uniref:hybrid sensor histidine kinase/response regulator n=1 Tax=Haloterrigena alkaliphila TaxID=2816475 RepID=UPI001CFFE3CE|nr:PAS domain S-box protein [Haloterrigena alkaliphila]UHQ95105.1 PAS domain S-box protein [Haloterrigena alkaliphila]